MDGHDLIDMAIAAGFFAVAVIVVWLGCVLLAALIELAATLYRTYRGGQP